MNFRIIEGDYADLDSIHDEFCEDYLFSTELSNVEIRKKYGLTVGEFEEFCRIVKKEFGFTRRPHGNYGKYYYKKKNGWVIQKKINGVVTYFGYVPSEKIAKELVRLCVLAGWEITICCEMVRNWRRYYGS